MAYKNKDKQAIAWKKYYEANKEKVKERAQIGRNISILNNKNFVAEYLKNHFCVDCNNSDPIVLEFDHVRGIKFKNVCDLVRGGYPLKTLKNEIEKCDVRCANCHRIVTYNRRLKKGGEQR